MDAQKVLPQRPQIFRALAQGLDVDHPLGEARVQVGAKLARFDVGFEVAVGRRDDPHVDGHLCGATDRSHAPRFEGAQQLRLNLFGELANLVEKQRTAFGRLEHPGSCGVGATEGALDVAKQLALDEIARDRGAVERAQRTAAPAALVQRLGDELFAHAGLSLDQNGNRGLGRALGALEGMPQRWAAPDQQPIFRRGPADGRAVHRTEPHHRVAEANDVAGVEQLAVDALAVDVRAIAAAQVAQEEPLAHGGPGDLRVELGHDRIRQLEITVLGGMTPELRRRPRQLPDLSPR